MKRMCLLLGGLAALVWCYPAALLPAADTKDDQGTVVDLGSLKSRTPATWKAEEPSNRMRFIELTVNGVNTGGDSASLTAALDKLPGSRGSSVRRLAGGEAGVKVWYSEKDPLAVDAVTQEVTKLGFKVN